MKADWKALKMAVRGYENPAEYLVDENHTQVRPGLRFWEYLCMANPKLEKPRIWVPHTLVNCSSNQQFTVWTDPRTGKIVCNPEGNYSEFEKDCLTKLESEISPREPDRKKKIDELKKHKYLFASRKRLNENDAMTVEETYD